MPDVSVDPEYIKSMAPLHQQAADVFAAAADTVSGSADQISASHGTVCNASKDALKAVEEAHNKLASALQTYSTELAARLDISANAYEDTDEWAAKRINQELS